MKNFNALIAIASLVWGLNWCKPLDKYDIMRMDQVNRVNALLSDAKITVSWNMVASCEILVTSNWKKVIETFSCGDIPLFSNERTILKWEWYDMKITDLRIDLKNPRLLNIEDGCMGIKYEDPTRDMIHGTTCDMSKDESTTKKPKLTT